MLRVHTTLLIAGMLAACSDEDSSSSELGAPPSAPAYPYRSRPEVHPVRAAPGTYSTQSIRARAASRTARTQPA